VRSELEKIEKGIPTTDRVVPQRKILTSREITVKFSLKKLLIPGLIVAALIVAAVIMIWRVLPQKEAVPAKSANSSIAVLPFDDLSRQKDQEYFCEGLANSIITALSNIRSLSVRARSSSFSFKGKERNIKEIGLKLNVETLIEGTVQKEGNELRVTAQLINVADESLLWSRQYSREFKDVFSIQDGITAAIADNLRLKLVGDEKARLARRYTGDIEAYNLYLKGIYYWNKRNCDVLKKAIEYFEQAIARDPKYALAYVGLADSYNLLADYCDTPPKESFPEAKDAARKALSFDDALAEAWNSLAYMTYHDDYDFKGAEGYFKRALELNPNYATGHFWYSELLCFLQRFDDAFDEAKKAMELDPVSMIINNNLGMVYFYARRYDQAAAQYRKAVDMDPGSGVGHLYLGYAYLQMKKFSEAMEEFESSARLLPGAFYPRTGLGLAQASAGNRDQAEKILKELETQSREHYMRPIHFVFLHAALGRNDKAFEWLEKAYQEKHEDLLMLKVNPFFDPLRSDPGFKSLLKRINLE